MILDDVYAFRPGQMMRLGRPPYKNVSGTLQHNSGDNGMAVAYRVCMADDVVNKDEAERDEDE